MMNKIDKKLIKTIFAIQFLLCFCKASCMNNQHNNTYPTDAIDVTKKYTTPEYLKEIVERRPSNSISLIATTNYCHTYDIPPNIHDKLKKIKVKPFIIKSKETDAINNIPENPISVAITTLKYFKDVAKKYLTCPKTNNHNDCLTYNNSQLSNDFFSEGLDPVITSLIEEIERKEEQQFISNLRTKILENKDIHPYRYIIITSYRWSPFISFEKSCEIIVSNDNPSELPDNIKKRIVSIINTKRQKDFKKKKLLEKLREKKLLDIIIIFTPKKDVSEKTLKL